MLNCQIELPSAVACVRSVGVVIRNSGDLSEGLDVKRRMVELGTVAEPDARAVDGIEGVVNGYGSVCTGSEDSEERIWTTDVGMKEGRTETPDAFLVSSKGTVPEGRTENMYGFTKAGGH